MAKIVGLPKLSPTMEEGTLARWAKSEGDALAIDDLVAEIETDKATMEWRALEKGVLLKILAPAGSTLAPDTPVAIVGERGEDVSALLASIAAPGAAAAPPSPTPSAPTPTPSAPTPTPSGAPSVVHEGRVPASPLVRRLARERDIDLHTISGSGPHGRIIKRDLDGVVAAPPARASAPTSSASYAFVASGTTGYERKAPVRQPISQMRKAIARRLTESKQTVPHFYLTIDVDAAPLLAARQTINATLEGTGAKVSVNDLIVKACALALRRVPACNAAFVGDALLYHQVVDISVAVAVPDGLLTPVVRDADRKGVAAISAEIRELAGRARDKKLKPEEMQNGTFSISNLGMYGIESFAAVINPPEGAILAVGSVRDEPVVEGGAIVPGKRLRMTLSCDHRVVDGAIGAEFLAALKKIIEAPLTMIL